MNSHLRVMRNALKYQTILYQLRFLATIRVFIEKWMVNERIEKPETPKYLSLAPLISCSSNGNFP